MAALAVAAASFLPKIPRDQTIRVDLGNLAPRVAALTIRWESATGDEIKGGIPRPRDANIEDWTGEVTFRYENGAPRVIEQKIHAADGDYVVEIEIESMGGRATTAKTISLAGGGTTIDVADLALPAPREIEMGDAGP